MAKAVWNGLVVAESENYEEIEGTIYFPPESVKLEYLRESRTVYQCAYRGTARYYSLEVNGQFLEDAAFYFSDPTPAVAYIQD